MASHFTLLLCISLAIVAVPGRLISRCQDCRLVKCGGGPETRNCTYGTVMNPCTCCFECLKGEGEECGGQLDVFGTCAEKLTCYRGCGMERPGRCVTKLTKGR
ncbi:single insulin-like growth factor-binding domain protein-1 isoform X1 [Macrobrachium nipponense]|uniref:single insulin-like growth factor-binding domain protein-1 isoform X1 n=1 Tax=Macrobrachium nipponense TaxID=159736 RepID=UPI0030C831C1